MPNPDNSHNNSVNTAQENVFNSNSANRNDSRSNNNSNYFGAPLESGVVLGRGRGAFGNPNSYSSTRNDIRDISELGRGRGRGAFETFKPLNGYKK